MFDSGYKNSRMVSPKIQNFQRGPGPSRPAWTPKNSSNPNTDTNFKSRYPNVKTPYPSKFNNHNRFNKFQKDSQEFWCETCDRGFKSQDMLNSHKSEHQVCGIDGCNFIAHPKVVTKHIQMQHSTGLYSRIRNVESPEDIAKWIEERKKKFPSKENIEKQKQQQAECMNRGEKIQDKKSRFNNRNKRDNNFKKRPNKWHQNKDANPECNKNNLDKKTPMNVIKVPIVVNEDVYCGLRAFKGISELTRLDIINDVASSESSQDNIDIEDDEWKEDNLSQLKTAPVCTALHTLMGAYSSSEDEADISKIDQPVLKPEIKSIDCDSGPEEAAIQKFDPIVDTIPTNNVNNEETGGTNLKRIRKRKKSISNINDDNSNITEVKKPHQQHMTTFERQLKYYKDRPSTLLEKLLEKEIKHERNVILQAINYIVKNNFFDK